MKKNIEDIYPLSPVQQGMLFHTLYAPESQIYITQISCLLEGTLQVPEFERAWQTVVDRHPILRTAFVWERRPEPLQIVFRTVRLSWIHEDWQTLSLHEQQERLQVFMRQNQALGFELSRPPLIRPALIRLAEDRHYLILCHHHLLMDGWSFPQMLAEGFSCYAAFCQGKTPQLLARAPYGDYIEWLGKQDLPKAERFWRSYLAGFLAPTPLDLEPPAGSIDDGHGETYQDTAIALPVQISQGLQALAREHQLTFSVLIQAAWALLLQRYSGEQDVVFGLATAGRSANLAGITSMIGLFVNTLPVRVHVAPGATLLSWLRELQENLAAVLEYEYSPLLQVQGWSQLPRTVPLFESLLIFDNYPVDELFQEQVGDLHIQYLQSIEHTNYPLSLRIRPGIREEVFLGVSYSRTRFSAESIAYLVEQMLRLLSAFIAQPFQRLKDFDLLSAREREQLLITWNATETPQDSPEGPSLQQAFEEQVARTPNATAVACLDRRLTYAELNRRANQLAHYLRCRGVGPEARVGVYMERGIDLFVALLGILKAGGAYVPLDVSYPEERISTMMHNARPVVLLSQQQFKSQLPSLQTQIILLDEAWPEIALQPEHNLTHQTSADNALYVIYTSGSTGTPKGVVGTHRATLNRLHWMWQNYPFRPQEICCQKTALTFVDSVWELFGPLLQGCPVVVIADEVVKDPALLVTHLEKNHITRLVLVPSLLRALLDSGANLAERLSALSLWICSGEGLSRSLARRFKAWLPRSLLLNLYGSSEVAADATFYEARKSEIGNGWVSIGRPIANIQSYVLDAQGQLAPIGVPGELYIGGAGLARGYFDRPDLTAERFVPHPFSKAAGARLYRTGDMARYRRDGKLEFLGRGDHQIKLHGFRIEPGEIESVLARYAQIQQSRVLLREDTPGEKRLVAYIQPAGTSVPSVNALRDYLSEKLPYYMLPAAFVFLSAFPLTPNGKIDYQGLPAPDTLRPRIDEKFVAARTPEEQILVHIWQQVLHLDQIGINDNFFDLGGHSLLAMQLYSRVREHFKRDFLLVDLFKYPTIASLAVFLCTEDQGKKEEVIQYTSITRRERTFAAIPLSFAQQRLWFLDQLEPGNAVYHIPLALRLRRTLNIATLERSLNEVIQRHEILRTTFATLEGRPAQQIHSHLPLPIREVDIQAYPVQQREEIARQLAKEEIQRPFDLSRGPLLRMTVFRENKESALLLLVVHHIVFDGRSKEIFFYELTTLYTALISQQVPDLPPLPVQYADYTLWQHEWLQGDVLEKQLGYWKRQFSPTPPTLQLPYDYLRPTSQTFRGGRHSFTLPSTLPAALRQLGHQAKCTLFVTLLAAFTALLSRYSGQEDLVIGTPVSGRNHKEIETLIGCFINTLALRLDLTGNPAFSEILKRVQKTTLEALEHQDIPFERLVEELQVERDPSRHPLFQVFFQLETAQKADYDPAGVNMWDIESDIARFDLALIMAEAGDDLMGVWEYNLDLFAAETISRIQRHFLHLLEALVTNPQDRLADLPLFSEAERNELLVTWNRTAAAYSAQLCIHQLFEEQVAHTPEKVALVYGDQQLSYSQLNQRANRLARYLQAAGVGPEARVGISMERSPDMLVAVLGVLKAGGAYVPLDPTYPAERLKFISDDAELTLLLTQQHLVERASTLNAKILCLDSREPFFKEGSAANLEITLSSLNLAYVIYTSGSTGKPKGVQIPHTAVVNFLQAMQKQLDLTVEDTFLAVTSLSFDIAALELFLPLLSGARLTIAAQAVVSDGERLIEQIANSSATVMQATPATWRMLIAAGWQGQAGMSILCGGEALAKTLAAELKARSSSVLNLYGPTETTIWSTCYPVSRVNESIPIGRPLDNTQIYILNRYLQPVPIGVPGDLYIGGKGLAYGYFQRPDLTAVSFIPHPFTATPGERLYKTGDIARYRPDGNIEYLGRSDFQVKLRGYRIELREIEAVLQQHPAIREAVVILRRGKQTEREVNTRLVAYFVVNQQTEVVPNHAQLHDFLQAWLPPYMIPSLFVPLETIPLTPNGKQDRQALLALQSDTGAVNESFVAASSPVEKALTHIWADVLDAKHVSIHDNFFTLGGHSLLATQVLFRIRTTLQVDLSLHTLFAAPTIAQLAAQITALRSEQSQNLAQPLALSEQGEVTGSVPLTIGQRWLLKELAASPPRYWHMPYVFSVQQALDPLLLEMTIKQILRHHDMLRLHLVWEETGWRQFIVPPDEEPIPFAWLNFSELCEDEQEKAAEAAVLQLQADLNQMKGWLLRIAYLDFGPQKPGHLVFIFSHMITDYFSNEILFQDFLHLYPQLARGEHGDLPLKTSPFKWWAERLSAYLQSEELQQEMERFWLALPWEKITPLPLDYPGGKDFNTIAANDVVHMSLSTQETEALYRCLDAKTQVSDILLTALAQAFYRWTGSPFLYAHVLYHGREMVFDGLDLSRTVGYIAFAKLLLLDISQGTSRETALTQVKKQLRSLPHQGIGLDLLLQLGDDATQEKLRHIPEDEVHFEYRGGGFWNSSDQALPILPVDKYQSSLIDETDSRRNRVLYISGEVIEKRLHIRWEYSRNIHKKETVRQLGSFYMEALRDLITMGLP